MHCHPMTSQGHREIDVTLPSNGPAVCTQHYFFICCWESLSTDSQDYEEKCISQVCVSAEFPTKLYTSVDVYETLHVKLFITRSASLMH